MKTVIAILALVMASSTVFAGAGGSFLECQSSDGKVYASVALQAVDSGGDTKGFSEGADHKFVGPTTSILKDNKKGTISAFASDSKGNFIHILASGLHQDYCSGCSGGLSNKYSSATVVTNGTYENITKTNLSCTLENENE